MDERNKLLIAGEIYNGVEGVYHGMTCPYTGSLGL